MTLSAAQRAVLVDLLELARKNERIKEDVEQHLPNEAIARFRALKFAREEELYPLYDDVVWEKYRHGNETLHDFTANQKIIESRFNGARNLLVRLFAERAKLVEEIDTRIKAQQAIMEGCVPRAWKAFYALPEDDKLWFEVPRSMGAWPPPPVEDAPIEVALPGVEMPVNYALRRVIEELLAEAGNVD